MTKDVMHRVGPLVILVLALCFARSLESALGPQPSDRQGGSQQGGPPQSPPQGSSQQAGTPATPTLPQIQPLPEIPERPIIPASAPGSPPPPPPPRRAAAAGQGGSQQAGPPLRKAIEAMRTARGNMARAEGEFHGHREKAIELIDRAIHEAELCLREP